MSFDYAEHHHIADLNFLAFAKQDNARGRVTFQLRGDLSPSQSADIKELARTKAQHAGVDFLIGRNDITFWGRGAAEWLRSEGVRLERSRDLP